MRHKVKGLDRLALLIRNHPYDRDEGTCLCISGHVPAKSKVVPMTVFEHSEHVAELAWLLMIDPPK